MTTDKSAVRRILDQAKAAGREAGTTQECATIDAAICVVLQFRGKRAAASFALCSLDQHGRLLTSPDSG